MANRPGNRVVGSVLLVLGLVAASVAAVQLARGMAPQPTLKQTLTPPGETPIATPPAPKPIQRPAEDLVLYDGPVEHMFFHPLVIYPDRAFKGPMKNGMDDWMITVSEFNQILQSVYDRGFVLVDFRDLFAEQVVDGKSLLVKKPLLLPRGKKPLIISIDDMNYYDYMRAYGNAYKLVLDADGKVATYSVDPTGHEVVSRENEVVPIVDAFVEAHPDFSPTGAKGIIALTGYEGVLGYRTQDRTAAGYDQERAAALQVIAKLKATGWIFASHGWGHLSASRISSGLLERDTQRWKEQVEPLIGPTSIYIYPFGAAVPAGTPKFEYLRSQGFRIFCAIGPAPYTPPAQAEYVITERKHVDGIGLRQQRQLLLALFDADKVIDLADRPKR